MKVQQIKLTACDGQKFEATYTKAHKQSLGTVQILHGMAEHQGRYKELRNYLNSEGYHVISHDHRGHGNRIKSGKIGHFADSLGWDLVIDDAMRVGKKSLSLDPGPIYLLGHSMGSFFAQKIITLEEIKYQGYILTGTDYLPSNLYKLLSWIPKAECLRLGTLSKSSLIQALTFKRFNRKFRPATNDFAWISANPENIKNYLSDTRCGFSLSAGAWYDLLTGLASIYRGRPRKLKSRTPVLIYNGEHDQISTPTQLEWMRQKLQSIGCSVTLKIVPKGRHEVLQEKDRKQTFLSIFKWMNRIGQKGPKN